MRGIAAFSVGLMHARGIFKLDTPTHAYLAVDFFFCLSGFVLAFAYDERLRDGMSYGAFLGKRLLRLYPMIFMGAVLGFGVTLLASRAGHLSGNLTVPVVLWLLPATLLMLPLGVAFGEISYPLNTSLWSLFYEFAANAVFALQRGRPRFDLIILALSALALAAVSLSWHGLEEVGFTNLPSLALGAVRVTYPFLAGVVIYRLAPAGPRSAVPGLLPAMLLTVVLLMPALTKSGLYDLAAVLIVFPALVTLGARVRPAAFTAPLWATLGRMSYPFYVVHQPVLRVAHQVCAQFFKAAPPWASVSMGLLAAALTSYLLLVLYDEPLRRWIARRGARKPTPSIASTALS